MKLDEIRSTAERVASFVWAGGCGSGVDGGGKSRALRVYLEKDAAGRAKLAGAG